MKKLENGVLTTHLRDIALICCFNMRIPNSILITAKRIIEAGNDETYCEIKFTDKDEIDFLMGIDFIIDVSKYEGPYNGDARKEYYELIRREERIEREQEIRYSLKEMYHYVSEGAVNEAMKELLILHHMIQDLYTIANNKIYSPSYLLTPPYTKEKLEKTELGRILLKRI